MEIVSKLNLSNFYSDKLVNMKDMFINCCELEELNIPNFDTKKLNEMGNIFHGCKKIKKLEMRVKEKKL